MHIRTVLLLSLALGSISAATVASPTRGDFWVIVNPSNPTTRVTKRFLSEVFLKKSRVWPGGETVMPVDLVTRAPVRERFSDDVLSRSVPAVKSYWQQQVFSGRDVPPPELDSDERVIQFVLKNPGAVGYVSPGAALSGAKVLQVD